MDVDSDIAAVSADLSGKPKKSGVACSAFAPPHPPSSYLRVRPASVRCLFQDAGMDIDKLVNDPMMESSMDSDAKEVVVLLRKLLEMWPK